MQLTHETQMNETMRQWCWVLITRLNT